MSEEEKREIKDILGKLFVELGLTENVVRLSQWIDRNVIELKKKEVEI